MSKQCLTENDLKILLKKHVPSSVVSEKAEVHGTDPLPEQTSNAEAIADLTPPKQLTPLKVIDAVASKDDFLAEVRADNVISPNMAAPESQDTQLLKEALKKVLEKLQEAYGSEKILKDELAHYKKVNLELSAQKPQIEVTAKSQQGLAIVQKKELEAQISSLSFEKATLLARLHELSQKSKQEVQGKDDLEKRLEEILKAHAILQESHNALETNLQEANAKLSQLQEIEQAFTELKAKEVAYKQELSVSQACVIERQQAFLQEHEKHTALIQQFERTQTQNQEFKEELQKVQQQLARRIKECAVLQRQCENEQKITQELQESLHREMQRANKLEASVEVLCKNEEQLRSELSMKNNLHEENMARLQERLHDLIRQSYAQKDELEVMYKQKARLQQLEELYARFGQIVTTSSTSFSEISKDVPFEYNEQ